MPDGLPRDMKIILASLAESLERQIQPHECVFEPSDDPTMYQLRVIGGRPEIIAWAVNDARWLRRQVHPADLAKFDAQARADTRSPEILRIHVRADVLAWEHHLRPKEFDDFTPAYNYTPRVRDEFGELAFQLTPFGMAWGSCCQTEPMAGFGRVLAVLVLVAGKALAPKLDKRTKEYRWLAANGYLEPGTGGMLK
jgi:hypothetical protein